MKIHWLKWMAPALMAWMVAPALAQIQQDDLAIGINSNTTNSFRIVRPGSGATPGIDEFGGEVGMTTPWSKDFIQSVEFDNANNISHNAQGNLLGANFGNAFTGFEVFNFATNGSGAFQSLWSIKTATGGARTDRGGGLSVSSDNSKIAWSDNDTGSIHVLEYNAGSNVGTGSGGSVTGWIETALGNGEGGNGIFTALTPGVTQATAWLNNNTVLSFNGYGELVSLDLTGTAFGSTSSPATTSNWSVVQSNIFSTSPSGPQSTGLIYNEQIAPDIIIGSTGFFSGGTSHTEIFVWDKNDFSQIAKIDISGSVDDGSSQATGREISLDSQGNLYIGGFGENVVSVINNFVDLATNGTLTNNSSVFWYQNDFFASFSGLDVASSVPISTFLIGDMNNDGLVDLDDVNPFVLGLTDPSAFESQFGYAPGTRGDINQSGLFDLDDVNAFVGLLTGDSDISLNLTVVPEPGSIGLFALAGLGLVTIKLRRMRRNS